MAEKTTGYRLEYAPSNRAKCKGPKPCSGTAINKGELRFGTLIDMRGNKTFIWRHWGCVTKKILDNVKNKSSEASDVDGFDALNPEDQARIIRAYQDGHVAEEDIPASAKKPTFSNASSSTALPEPCESPRTDTRGLDQEISAQDISGSANDRMPSRDITDDHDLKPRNLAFEPIVLLPEFPVPSLDFRLRKVGTVEIPGNETIRPSEEESNGDLKEETRSLSTDEIANLLNNGRTTCTPEVETTDRQKNEGMVPFEDESTGPSKNETTGVPDPIANYKENPLRIVGQRFLFVDTKETWEVSEITFGKRGWGTMMIKSGERIQRIEFEVFMSMLKKGVLDVIQGQEA